MKNASIPPVAAPGLEVTTGWEGNVLRVVLVGTADGQAMAPLAMLTSNVHTELRRSRAPEVVVDLRKVEFMNSSCFKVLVTWLRQLSSLAPDEKYVVRFLADARRPWQERSLAALQAFATDSVKIDRG